MENNSDAEAAIAALDGNFISIHIDKLATLSLYSFPFIPRQVPNTITVRFVSTGREEIVDCISGI